MSSHAYNLERAKRRPLTKKNLRELDIEQSWKSVLDHPNLVWVDERGVAHRPVGFSVNKSSFGTFDAEPAHKLGWLAYMNLGEPLIEERGDVIQPPPDMFSSRSYVNRSSSETMEFTDSVQFTVSNAITWSLQGEAQLSFGGNVGAELQLQLQNELQLALGTELGAQLGAQVGAQVGGQLGIQVQNDLENKNTVTVTNENSKDDVGVDVANATETGVKNSMANSASGNASGTAGASAGTSIATTVTGSTAFTVQGTATGNAELNAQLVQGVTASVGGTLTTGWTSESQISGKVPPESRVATMATQRRTRKQFSYEIPVTFSGLFAVQYAVPVAVLSPPQATTHPGLSRLVARPIGDIDLAGGNGFRMRGWAEVVSALEVDHTMFDGESLTGSRRALHKKP
ncbi:hypothetical protein [Streptomyces sp. NPDC058486]|uniref:hypothetical protein n=1 Tax=unclassified Streptomyces TaxID=2593676 RepID=UPI00365EAF5F